MIPFRSDPQKAQNGRKRRKAFFGPEKSQKGLEKCDYAIIH